MYDAEKQRPMKSLKTILSKEPTKAMLVCVKSSSYQMQKKKKGHKIPIFHPSFILYHFLSKFACQILNRSEKVSDQKRYHHSRLFDCAGEKLQTLSYQQDASFKKKCFRYPYRHHLSIAMNGIFIRNFYTLHYILVQRQIKVCYYDLINSFVNKGKELKVFSNKINSSEIKGC